MGISSIFYAARDIDKGMCTCLVSSGFHTILRNRLHTQTAAALEPLGTGWYGCPHDLRHCGDSSAQDLCLITFHPGPCTCSTEAELPRLPRVLWWALAYSKKGCSSSATVHGTPVMDDVNDRRTPCPLETCGTDISDFREAEAKRCFPNRSCGSWQGVLRK